MKTSRLDCGDATYDIREIPAALMRRHADITTPNAQMDMLGMCVLDAHGQPIGDAIDDLVPMRHLEQLINAIAELSGLLEGNGAAPDIETST